MKPEDLHREPLAAEFLDIPDPLQAPIGRAPLPAVPSEASPTRLQLGRRRALALGVAALWPLVLLAVWGFRQRGSADMGFMAAQGATWTALIALASFLSFSRGRRGLGAPIRAVEAVVLGGLLVFFFVALFWLPSGDASAFAEMGPPALLPPCLSLGLFASLPMLLVATWPMRRTLVNGAAWRGAALGVAAGFGAVLVLTLHCSSTFGGHIALAHGAPLLVAAVAGAILGARLGRA
jgi:hypothetical protein